MALSIDISTEDLIRIERLLRSALSQSVPAGNFKEGSFLNDVVVRAMAVIPAIVEKEAKAIRNRQSLNTITDLSPIEVDQALEDLVSNWFVTRKTGTRATGIATVHLSADVDEVIVVPNDASLTYSPGIDFVLDSVDPLVLNRDEQLTAVLDSDSSVLEYLLYLPIVSTALGASGNVPPGKFQRLSSFSPYIKYAELENGITIAKANETNGELIERAKSSLTERGMITSKSIKAVLREDFVEVQDVVVIGAGAPEMQRDLVTDVAFGLAIHVLGHVNVYCLLPVVRSARYPVGGGTVALADEVATHAITTLSTTNLPFLRIKSVLLDAEPLKRVSIHSYVDDDDETQYLVYKDGEYADRDDGELLEDEYALEVGSPSSYGSMEQAVTLRVGAIEGARTLSFEYDGVRGLYSPHLALKDRERRIVASNALAFSFIPVVLTISISYYKKSTAPAAFPVAEAKAALAAYLNTTLFPNGLRVSDLVVFLMGSYPLYIQGVVLPITVSYVLQAPSGREIAYTTQNKISVESMALLVEPTAYSSAARLAEQVSDTTVRFVSFEDLITLTEIS